MSLSRLARRQDVVDTCSVSKPSTVVGSLGALLEHEYLLLKVLAYVVDDGLHECRLVCRHWREACRRLPVRIRADVSSISVTEMVRQVTEKFPEAASLCLVDRSRKKGLGVDALPWLSEIRKLHTMQVPFRPGHQVAEGLRPILLSMDRLRSLSFHSDDATTHAVWMDTLRRLVHLTYLDVHAPCNSHAFPEPITELQRLLHLSGNARSLVRSDGRLVFQSLTRLTGLRFSDAPHLGPQDWTAVHLQSFLPYAASLRSLDIEACTARRSFQGWLLLSSFSRLEKLVTSCFALRDADFPAALVELSRLTEVTIAGGMHPDGQVSVDPVLALTGLKSLSIDPCRDIVSRRRMADSLAAMTQLTRLAATGSICAMSLCGTRLRHLPEMVDLEITIFRDSQLHLSRALARMPNLVTLRVSNRDSSLLLLSSALQPLKKLKTLELWKTDVESDFLSVLGTLPELTELSFVPKVTRFDVHRFYAQLSLLCNLRVLGMPSYWPVIGFLIRPAACRVPRLQRILFIADGDSVKFCFAGLRLICTEKSLPRSVLFRTFPCLRSIHFLNATTFKRNLGDNAGQIYRLV